MSLRLMKRFITTALLLSSIALVSSCGEKKNVRPAQGSMDNTSYHVLRGNDALTAGNFTRAEAAFQKAIELKSNDADALSGKAVALANIAVENKLQGSSLEKISVQVFSLLEKAKDNAEGSKKTSVYERLVQAHVILKQPKDDWFDEAQTSFQKAIDLSPNNERAYFYMARAYAENGMYGKAAEAYQKVLSFKGSLKTSANREFEILQKIQRAQPTSQFGKTIAFIPAITKADIAALFIAELNLNRLYQKNKKQFDNSYQVPGKQRKFKGKGPQKISKAYDILGHPLEATIKDVLKMKIRGLEADAAHKFHPNKPIKRAEYAVMLEDMMIKITKDAKISTNYIGQSSPFPDVRSDAWFYNAARVMTEKGIMVVTNKVNSTFEPLSNVSGADALLAVSEFKQALSSYLK